MRMWAPQLPKPVGAKHGESEAAFSLDLYLRVVALRLEFAKRSMACWKSCCQQSKIQLSVVAALLCISVRWYNKAAAAA